MKYVQVILPLKLEWIPFYRAEQEEITVGDKVRVPFAGAVYIGVVYSVQENIPEKLKDIRLLDVKDIESDMARISQETLSLWIEMADYYLCSVGEVYKCAFPALKMNQELLHAKQLEKLNARKERLEGMLARARTQRTRERYSMELEEIAGKIRSVSPTDGPAILPEDTIELSEAQEQAYSSIIEGFSERKPVLLEGVTGSGKTEIYLKLAFRALEQGKNVLYLVPEIALSRQLEDRLESHLKDRLLVFHSEESPSRRGRAAALVAMQDSRYVVLGTRSSLFLPHHDLGLIIVDEEHDSSYKQNSPAPRYNGRDVAVMMTSGKCDIILGSATPSMESLYNCLAGKYRHVRLDNKFYGSEEADIEIIDTSMEYRKNGMQGSFSRKLSAHIRETLDKGGQMLILRNRRSFSPAVQCSVCGLIPKCPNCNISLSYHRDSESLQCHHCGYKVAYNHRCGKCGGEMKGLGAGTQRIEEEAAALFPEARIARLDGDVGNLEEIKTIKSFSEGKTDILVGTQIISKGFDFNRLSLVAVINADSLLGVQDFRADEKTFQMLRQLGGRCSRRGEKGLTVIQTRQPGHPVFRMLESGNDRGLVNEMLMERQVFSYPPFTRLVNIELTGADKDRNCHLADILSTSLKEKGFDASGAYDTPRGKCIQVTFKRDRNLASMKKKLKSYTDAFSKENKCADSIHLDIDPL